jgi:hypothetical protein
MVVEKENAASYREVETEAIKRGGVIVEVEV